MAQIVFDNLGISAMAASVPKQVVDNHDWASVLGADVTEKVIHSIGIEKHRKALRRQTAGDLAFSAADYLLKEKGINKQDLGAVIFITTTPDYMVPATAFVIHKRLGLSEECIAFDVNISCAGFVYGLQIVGSLLQNMKKKYALLLNGQAPKHLEVANRKNPEHSALMMFGDAATATLLEKTKNRVIRVSLNVDSSDYKSLCTLGGCRCPDASREVSVWSDGKEHSLFDAGMDGMAVFSFATMRAPESITNFLKESDTTIDKYDAIFLHQANQMIVNRIIKLINADKMKCHISLGKYGNTSGCSIPLGMVDAYGESQSNDEVNVLMCGFGSGMAWGTASCRIRPCDILPLIESDEIYEEGEIHPF